MMKISGIIFMLMFIFAVFTGCAKQPPSGPQLTPTMTLTLTPLPPAQRTATIQAQATLTATAAVPPFKAQWSFPLYNGPMGITVDKTNGFVYATQWAPGAVVKFSMTGNVITQWGTNGSGPGQLGYTDGIRTDSAGDLYICDDGNERVQKFTPAGVYLLLWGGPGSADGLFDGGPIGLALDSIGNIFATDQVNARVQKFDPGGAFLSKFGSHGTNDGQFENTGDIYIDNSDNIYVTDFNGRVQKFSHQGVFLMKFGGSGSEIGQLESPAGIVVNAAGDIYVSDWGNNRIEKFNSQGAYITHWGSTFASPGSGPGEFNGPEGLALDAAGNLYVADHGNQRIQIFGY